MVSSQRESRPSNPLSLISGRSVEMLLNESHLIDFFQSRNACADLCQAALAQRDHALFARGALDLRGGTAIHNHFADAIGKVQQFTDSRAAVESGTATFQAAGTFDQRDGRPDRRIQAG